MGRVYTETSFISACVSTRQDPRSQYRREESRRWWAQQRHIHELCISAEVVRELSSPKFPHRDDALAMASRASMLPVNDEAIGLAKALVRQKVMPGPAEAGDAIHLSVAIVHQADVVLSWNVRHLANRNKTAHLREICRRLGYVPPEILTPDTYWIENEGD